MASTTTTIFTHAAHVSFIHYEGKMVPWHVSITSTQSGFKTIMIGLNTDDLVFNYEDTSYNLRIVDSFPRPKNFHLDYKFRLDNFETNLRTVFDTDIHENDYCPEIAALDKPTYNYLLKIIPSFNLKLKYTKPDDRTLAHAYRQESDIKHLYIIDGSFIRHQGKMIPWHIAITSSNFQTTLVGLSTEDLKFDIEDIEYNISTNEHFPRPDSLKLDYCFHKNEFENRFFDIYMDCWNYEEFYPHVAVLSKKLFYYLLNFLSATEDLEFINIKSSSEDKTLAAVYRQSV